MAKKKGYTKKSPKDEQKKNSPKPLPKGGAKKSSREKEKSKRRSGLQPPATSRNVKGKLQKKKSSLKKRGTLKNTVKGVKRKSPLRGRIRDFRGKFVEQHYADRLKQLRKELVANGIVINGRKVTPFTSYATITKAIYENKLFTLAESHTVNYFDVLGKIVTEANALKDNQEIFVKIKPFFKDFRVFNIRESDNKKDKKINSYYSQAVSLNPQLVMLTESQKDLIQRVIDEFPQKIVSPLFKIKEKRFENPLTGATYALEYDYNDILPSGMDKGEFIDFLQAIMGDEYKKIALLRIRANLGNFSEDE